jgi:hypothetical protein
MKYLVPPIVIPILLVIGIVAYGLLREPIIDGHSTVPAVNSQPRLGAADSIVAVV